MKKPAMLGMLSASLIINLSAPVLSQQYYYKQTQQQCSALGGEIRTWTNTAGVGQNVGECYVPPGRGGSEYGATAPVAGANKAAAAFGFAAGALGILNAYQQAHPYQPPETGSIRSPGNDSKPSTPSDDNAEGVFDLARSQSNSDPCRAGQNFERAARLFEKSGNTARAADAHFQASFKLTECKEAMASNAAANNGEDGAAIDCRQDGSAPRVHIDTVDVSQYANDQCGKIEDKEGLEFKRCIRKASAEVIFQYEPDIRAACGAMRPWPDSLDRCAVNKYDKLWQQAAVANSTDQTGQAGAEGMQRRGDANCQFAKTEQNGQSPQGPLLPEYKNAKPDGRAAGHQSDNASNAGAGKPSNQTAKEKSNTVTRTPGTSGGGDQAQNAPPGKDEAWQNYMDSTGSMHDYHNNGTFDQHPDMSGLEPTPEVRREIEGQ